MRGSTSRRPDPKLLCVVPRSTTRSIHSTDPSTLGQGRTIDETIMMAGCARRSSQPPAAYGGGGGPAGWLTRSIDRSRSRMGRQLAGWREALGLQSSQPGQHEAPSPAHDQNPTPIPSSRSFPQPTGRSRAAPGRRFRKRDGGGAPLELAATTEETAGWVDCRGPYCSSGSGAFSGGAGVVGRNCKASKFDQSINCI